MKAVWVDRFGEVRLKNEDMAASPRVCVDASSGHLDIDVYALYGTPRQLDIVVAVDRYGRGQGV